MNLCVCCGLALYAPFGYDLNDLTEFAAIRRYLEGYEEYSAEEVASVLRAVKDALVWCQSKVAERHAGSGT